MRAGRGSLRPEGMAVAERPNARTHATALTSFIHPTHSVYVGLSLVLGAGVCGTCSSASDHRAYTYTQALLLLSSMLLPSLLFCKAGHVPNGR